MNGLINYFICHYTTLLLYTTIHLLLYFILLYRFHTGSLAFGALIIAIIQLIRIILAYIQKKLKRNKESKIASAILTCMQCCFYLLEKVFKYINRQAYIEIAIYGYDFCTGACKAVKLILRNIIT